MCIRECVVLFCCHRIISVSIFLYRAFYLFSIWCLCLYLWPGFFVTAVTPVLSNQRAAVLRQGGHVLSRLFRYYVPDFSGRMVVQTPIIVRWVPILIFHFFFWLFLRFRFLCILIAVGCCWLLDDGFGFEFCLDKCYFHLCRWFRFAQLAKGKKFRP